jgi:hypothetical protein
MKLSYDLLINIDFTDQLRNKCSFKSRLRVVMRIISIIVWKGG